MTSRRRVLIFAYYFPPLAGGGVQRTLKYVKYLPDEGFDSILVTGSRRGFFLRDRTLSEEVPAGTVMLRAKALPLQQAHWKVDGLLRRTGLSSRPIPEMLWPDGLVGWIPAAVSRGLQAVRAHRPHVLYSTSSPTTSHLTAMIVHRLTGLPWVADFRDPWALAPRETQPMMAALTRANPVLERAVVETASYVTVADDTIQLAGMPADDPRRIVIPNGVDPDDLAPEPREAHPAPDPSRFTLCHVGSLYGPRNAQPVFAAVRDLLDQGKLDPAWFQIRIVGHTSINGVAVDSLPLVFTGFVHHRRAITEMANATALLLYQPPDYHTAAGKLHEYLTSGRPLLCVTERNNLACRLVSELRAGVCAEPQDHVGIVTAIERLVGAWRAGVLHVDTDVRREMLRRYSRKKLTTDLAAVLRAAVDEQRAV